MFVCFASVVLVALLGLAIPTLVLVASLPAHQQPSTSTTPGRTALAAGMWRPGRALEHFSAVALNATALDHTDPSLPGSGVGRVVWREHMGPMRAARAMAMVHGAMADAVAVCTRAYAPLAPGVVALSDAGATDAADVDAAIGAAAHAVLAALYRGQTAITNRAYAAYAAAHLPIAMPGVREGTALGERVGALWLAWRADDGADSPDIDAPVAEFASDEPGRWRNDPVAPAAVALGARWADRVRPFVMTEAGQFVVPPPPLVTSDAYAMEYYEVRALGGVEATCARDEWRAFVGRFWAYDGTAFLCAPIRLYLQFVHAVAEQRALTLPVRARLLGLAAVAMADAGTAAWHSKYLYRRERPVTAVRDSAARDGNPATVADPAWTPLGAPNTNRPGAPNFTPPFPAYPSGHATFGGALAQTLRIVLGDDGAAAGGVAFVSDEYDGRAIDAATGRVRPRVARHFSSFSEAEEENGQSRMYLGIHWASDKTAGIAQGRQVADWVAAHAYQ